jgi:hypothetical protein
MQHDSMQDHQSIHFLRKKAVTCVLEQTESAAEDHIRQ